MDATSAFAQVDVTPSGTGDHDTVRILRTMHTIAAYGNIVTRPDTIHWRLMSQDDINLNHCARLGVRAGIREARRDDGNFIVLIENDTVLIGHARHLQSVGYY
jgi:hypothetical protein